ncbi:hypothetical protein [Micromonospora sp. AMSO12t]|uniref:hypothetical protein n=1 Tax=Micromonospora sp. AMSO12t TaxID=2650410 RepID=UPI001CEC7306|nr:hypothetical protein [Micromonospora sp. AMSO12t]
MQAHDLEVHVPMNEQRTPQIAPVSRSRRRLSRAGLITAITAGVVAAGAGTAAAVAYLTEETVASGMPGAAVIFEGTDPSCTTTDHVVFDCTLSRAPKSDVLPNPAKREKVKTAPRPAATDYTDVKHAFVDDQGNIAGGCKGVDAAGLHWVCYAGQRAVTEGVIAQRLLGEHLDSPARG